MVVLCGRRKGFSEQYVVLYYWYSWILVRPVPRGAGLGSDAIGCLIRPVPQCKSASDSRSIRKYSALGRFLTPYLIPQRRNHRHSSSLRIGGYCQSLQPHNYAPICGVSLVRRMCVGEMTRRRMNRSPTAISSVRVFIPGQARPPRSIFGPLADVVPRP